METNYPELYEKMTRLQWLLRRQQMQIHMEHGPFADASRGQGRVLAILKLQSEISAKDLSYLLGIRQQSLNELLNKLEKGGYVERIPSETDKRVLLVRLTEKGKNEQQNTSTTDFTDIFDCLTPEEQETFGSYLDRIIAALESRLGTDDDDDKMESWMQAARSRMGAEHFDKLMAMRGGIDGHGPGPGRRGFHGDFGGECGPFGGRGHKKAPHESPRHPHDHENS